MAFLIRVSEKSLRAARSRWLIAIAVISLAACFLRLVDLQLVRGRALEDASDHNHMQILVEHAPRGRILDRHGKILADNQPVFVAFFSPLGLAPSDLQLLLERLAPIVDVEKPELEHRLLAALRAKTMLRVSDRLSRDQAFLILQNRVHLPGVSLTIEEQRTYPGGKLASHVLGYVGQITDEELEQSEGYRAGDWIGKTGLERRYDEKLQGEDGGFLMEVDALGRQVRIIQQPSTLVGTARGQEGVWVKSGSGGQHQHFPGLRVQHHGGARMAGFLQAFLSQGFQLIPAADLDALFQRQALIRRLIRIPADHPAQWPEQRVNQVPRNTSLIGDLLGPQPCWHQPDNLPPLLVRRPSPPQTTSLSNNHVHYTS